MKNRSNGVLTAVVAGLCVLQLIQLGGFMSGRTAIGADDSDTAVLPVVRASAIEVVNKEGKVVAQLFSGEDGGGNIRLRSGDGMVRMKIGATPDGSGIVLMDTNAEPAVQIRSKAGATSVRLAQVGKETMVIEP